MKKLTILISVFIFAAIAAEAQGIINANNLNSGVLITIGYGQFPIGTPATAVGYTGAGPGQVSLSLYAALNGTPLSTLESSQSLIATGFNPTSTLPPAQGTEAFGNPFTLPTKTGFDGSQPLEFIFYGRDATGVYDGWSAEATGIVPGPASEALPPFPPIFGTAPGEINYFIIGVPEPATFVIAGAGVAALALFRRRN